MSNVVPSVSICIPTYNYCEYLSYALDSALAQSRKDIEVVVVDDYSTDGSVALVKEYARRDNRVVLYENPQRLGLTRNFNQSLRLARGKYVKFLCADDVLAAQCVEKMVSAFEAEPSAMLVGCRRFFFNDAKHVIGERGYGRKSQIVDGRRAIHKCFFAGNLIGEPTAVLFRKADFDGGFNEDYFQALDMELWFRLLEQGSFVFLAEALCGIREHPTRGTNNNLRAGNVVPDKIRIFDNYMRKSYLHGSLLERLLWDSRMASSVARQSAAGAPVKKETVRSALYFPRIAEAALVPIASMLVKLGCWPDS